MSPNSRSDAHGATIVGDWEEPPGESRLILKSEPRNPMDSNIYIVVAGAGAAGGFAWFLCGIKFGRLRNNKYVRKAAVETVGGLTVASFVALPLSPIFSGQAVVALLAFGIGTCWSAIVQILRRKVTKFVEDQLNGGGGDDVA